jgi:hypothetical protein
LGHSRAEYDEQIVVTLSRQLVAKFGRGFEEKNLRRMMQFAERIGVNSRLSYWCLDEEGCLIRSVTPSR